VSDLRTVDTIVRTGEALDRAMAELDRTHLRALADRLELNPERPKRELDVAIRRRLLRIGRAR
jgi:hypothetical protein